MMPDISMSVRLEWLFALFPSDLPLQIVTYLSYIIKIKLVQT